MSYCLEVCDETSRVDAFDDFHFPFHHRYFFLLQFPTRRRRFSFHVVSGYVFAYDILNLQVHNVNKFTSYVQTRNIKTRVVDAGKHRFYKQHEEIPCVARILRHHYQPLNASAGNSVSRVPNFRSMRCSLKQNKNKFKFFTREKKVKKNVVRTRVL